MCSCPKPDINPERVYDLAKVFTPVPDIAALLGCDVDYLREQIANAQSELGSSYLKGRAETALEIRKQEINMACSGSPLAIQQARVYLDNMINLEKD